MKIYMSKRDSEVYDLLHSFQVTSDIKDAEVLLLLPNHLGSFHDFAVGVKQNKKMIIYNKDSYFAPIFPIIKEFDIAWVSENITMVDDINHIIQKLEEEKNGKIDNGETSKLL